MKTMKIIRILAFAMLAAVSVVMGAEERKEDRKKAGEVLSYFDGAEMFEQMCRGHDEFSVRFNSLVQEYRSQNID